MANKREQLRRLLELAAVVISIGALKKVSPRQRPPSHRHQTNSDNNVDDVDYQLFAEYSDLLRDRHAESSRSFDKALGTLAGGALALSITFVNVIAPAPEGKALLGLAWGLFAAALLANLLSFYFAERDYFHSIEGLNEDFDAGRFPGDITPTKYEKLVPKTNRLGLTAFVIGLAFLVIFAIVNLGVS